MATVRTTGGGMPSQSGSIIGTPSYMSPEQARGEVEDLDEQADVFALGSILCEVLTGQPAYIGSRPEILREAAEGCLDGAFARLDSCAAENELIQLARRCLDPSPDGRGPATPGCWRGESRVSLRRSASGPGPRRSPRPRRGRRPPPSAGQATDDRCSPGARARHHSRRRPRDSSSARRRARAERAVADMAALSWKAEWFRDQAAQIPPDQLGHWAKALAHVRRTAEIVGAGDPDKRTRQDVRKLVADLKREEERVRERAEEYHPGHQRRPSASPPHLRPAPQGT